MTDNEIIKALECCFTNEDCSLCPLFRKCPTSFELEKFALDLINRQRAEIKIQSQNFKVLVSDHRCLRQSFDNLKGLYREEKARAESAKSKSIYWAKELQKARVERDRMTALAAEWKDAAYTYADSIDKIKAEELKELADKTHKMITAIYNKHIFGRDNDLTDEEKDAIINFSDDIVSGFENIVKEMVGEEK